MVTGFVSVPIFKFVIQPLEGIGPYFEKLDVLGPSFVVSFIFGVIFSYAFPPQKELQS